MPRKIGIVGGLAWRSTANYFAAIHELAAEAARGTRPPLLEVAVESLDLGVGTSLLVDGQRDGRWEGFDNYHRAALMRLERSEAEIAIMACNLPHERLPEIRRGTGIELVDQFDALAAEAQSHGPRRLLVLGSPAAMASRRLRTLLAARGIKLIVARDAAAARLQQLISDLQKGPVTAAAERLVELARACGIDSGSRDLVALHCAELPRAFPDPRSAVYDWQGTRFLNVSMIHVRALLGKAGFGQPQRTATA